jgi:hypothetical protein
MQDPAAQAAAGLFAVVITGLDPVIHFLRKKMF